MMVQSHAAVEAREARLEHEDLARSELFAEVRRSLDEIRTSIDRIAERRGSRMSESTLSTLSDIDRLLYDIVLDLARLDAAESSILRISR
jgi:hypothetical protein